MELEVTTKGRFRFSKKERITHPQDFRRVMKFGRKFTSKSFILFMEKNQDSFHRLGIVVKKEVGPATFRNRIRRYIREFFRLHKYDIKGSFNIILLVRKGCSADRYGEAEGELKRLFVL
jgi:ribonuclease P protein component